MAKQSKKQTMLYLDRHHCARYSILDNKIVINDDKDSKDMRYISCVATTNIIKTTIEIEKNLSDDLIADMVYESAYEELSLDFDIEYIIRYIRRNLNYDGTKFEYDVYLLAKDTLLNEYSECIKTTPYIDFIVPSPFLFEVLYQRDMVPSATNVDCYVYFGNNDSFLAVYSAGMLLYYKALTLNLTEQSLFFNDFSPTALDFESFKAILSKLGDDSEYLGTLDRLYNEIYIQLDEVVTYVKRVYDIRGIDSLYIDSPIDYRSELYVYLESFFNIKCQKYTFLKNVTEREGLSPLYYLAIIYGEYYNKKGKCDVNFTIFHRPPPYSKRYSGKFINYTLFGLLIAIAYPIYGYYAHITSSKDISIKQKELENINRDLNSLKSIVNTLKGQRDSEQNRYNENIQRSKNFTELLNFLDKRGDEYSGKTRIISLLVTDIARNGVGIENLKIDGTKQVEIKADLISKEAKKVATLIRELGDSVEFKITPQEIKKDGEYYKSSIVLVVK